MKTLGMRNESQGRYVEALVDGILVRQRSIEIGKVK
jgi:hypothetical protein